MAEWIYTRDEIKYILSEEELRELVVVTPFRDAMNASKAKWSAVVSEVLESDNRIESLRQDYKAALAAFKAGSLNADGTIRALRKRKEEAYKAYRSEVEEGKKLDLKKKECNDELRYHTMCYTESMESYVLSQLAFLEIRREQAQRAGRRRGEARLRREERNRFLVETHADFMRAREEERMGMVSIPETVVRMSREELEAPMEDVCIICMETHAVGETVTTCCGHRYGAECFGAWHKQRVAMGCCGNCPMCKKEGISLTRYEEEEVLPMVHVLTDMSLVL
jgi:hypothetical protein